MRLSSPLLAQEPIDFCDNVLMKNLKKAWHIQGRCHGKIRKNYAIYLLLLGR